MYRWIEHTGELELEVESDSEQGVFEEALAAFRELVADGEGAAESESVRLVSRDRATLFADWLAELAFLAETRQFVPLRADRIELAGDGLLAEVAGERGSPPPLVKAVTYHRLSFERAGDRFRARAVLDV
jgi:SHS2 domain-containing protein